MAKRSEEGPGKGVPNFHVAERKTWCNWSQRHCLFFVLISAAVLFFYSINLKEIRPQFNPKLWNPFKKQGHVKIIDGGIISSTKAPTPAQHIDSTPVLHTTSITPTAETNTSMQTTQNTTMATSVVLYKSPGPYLVEYPYDYHFIINEPHACEQQKPFVVLMVPVGPSNRAHRDVIRSTWGGERLVLGKVVKLIFLVARYVGEGAEHVQERLLQESKEHHDVVQSDFVDCYKNLTIKTMVMLEWLDAYCSPASYAMKIDSDTFLNVQNLINMLSTAPKVNYMTGLVARNAAVLRDKTSKWYLPEELYPHPQYPRYALGLGYVFSLDLTKKLVEASKYVKALYIEDVYLGLCMEHAGIPPTDPPSGSYFHVFPVNYNRCAFSRLVVTTTRENTDRVSIWKDFKKPGPHC